MNILVCGSRKWPTPLLPSVDLVLERIVEGAQPAQVKIISGGAKGPDTRSVLWAFQEHLHWHEETAHWEVTPSTPPEHIRTRPDGSRYNVMAGFERNRRMLDMGIDLVVAFQANRSSGTQDTIDEARRRDIPVRVITPKDVSLFYGRD